MLDKFLRESNLSPGTKRSYLQSFKLLLAFSKKDILQITTEDLSDFRESRQHLQRSTLNKNMMAFSSFYSWAKEKGLVEVDPTRSIDTYSLKKSEKIRVNYITHEKALTLIAQPLRPKIREPSKMQLRDRAILATLYYAGLRTSEVCNLEQKQVRDTYLVITETKGHSTRMVEISPVLVGILSDYLKEARPKRYVFEKKGKSLSTNAIRDIVKKYANAAGIIAEGEKSQVTPLTLRHSYATYLTQQGVSPLVLGELMGNPTAVHRYAHPTKEAKERAASLFE